MATIKQVAEEAGLSKSTVSRYISQKGYVSDEARDKIKAAIDKLHYSPNVLAQSLKTKKNQLVGLLLPDISNPFFPRLARGAEEYLKEKGYRAVSYTHLDVYKRQIRNFHVYGFHQTRHHFSLRWPLYR